MTTIPDGAAVRLGKLMSPLLSSAFIYLIFSASFSAWVIGVELSAVLSTVLDISYRFTLVTSVADVITPAYP